jgi:Lon protease-like protein
MPRLEDADLEDVPVFPLPHVVLFPEARLPLHIFEPRYQTMLEDCLASPPKTLIVAQVDRRTGAIREVAGIGRIVAHEPMPDGRSNIIVEGIERVRLEEIVGEDPPRFPYKRARAVRLPDRDCVVSESDRAALVAAATMFTTEVKKHDPSFTFTMPRATLAGGIADTCAFQLIVDGGARQAVLEELDPRVRVRMVVDQLALQHGAMLGETKGAVLN